MALARAGQDAAIEETYESLRVNSDVHRDA
jgi:hypothetical protein